MNLTEKIIALRNEKRLKPVDMANALEMAPSNYFKFEKKDKDFTINQLEKVAAVLEVTLDDLLHYGEPANGGVNVGALEMEIKELKRELDLAKRELELKTKLLDTVQNVINSIQDIQENKKTEMIIKEKQLQMERLLREAYFKKLVEYRLKELEGLAPLFVKLAKQILEDEELKKRSFEFVNHVLYENLGDYQITSKSLEKYVSSIILDDLPTKQYNEIANLLSNMLDKIANNQFKQRHDDMLF